MDEKKRKKIRWKSWLFLLILALVAYVLYFFPGAGAFLGSFLTFSSDAQKKTNQEAANAVFIYMRFANDVLEIDGIPCAKSHDLEEKIRLLKKKYFPSEIHVTYLEQSNDPYLLAKQAEKVLISNNFGFKIKKNENHEK